MSNQDFDSDAIWTEIQRQYAERDVPVLTDDEIQDALELHTPAMKITYARCSLCGETWPCTAFRAAVELDIIIKMMRLDQDS